MLNFFKKKYKHFSSIIDDPFSLFKEEEWVKRVGDKNNVLEAFNKAENQDKIQSARYYESNSLAKEMVNLAAGIVFNGWSVSTDNIKLQKWINKNWNSENDLSSFLPRYIKESMVFGELCLRAVRNETTGEIFLANIDSRMIKKAIPAKDNTNYIDRIEVYKNEKSDETEFLKVIRKQTDDSGKIYYEGEVFFFTYNSLMSTSRGIPDLFPIFTFLDGFNTIIKESIRRIKIVNWVVWHLTLENAEKDEIDKKTEDIKSVKPGSVVVTGSNEKYELAGGARNGGRFDADKIANMIIRACIIVYGFPEHFFAEGRTANRATATEMGTPVVANLTKRQNERVSNLRFVFDYIIWSGIKGKSLSAAAGGSTYSINVNKITSRDIKTVAEAAKTLAEFVDMTKDKLKISEDQAREIYQQIYDLTGLTLSNH